MTQCTFTAEAAAKLQCNERERPKGREERVCLAESIELEFIGERRSYSIRTELPLIKQHHTKVGLRAAWNGIRKVSIVLAQADQLMKDQPRLGGTRHLLGPRLELVKLRFSRHTAAVTASGQLRRCLGYKRSTSD